MPTSVLVLACLLVAAVLSAIVFAAVAFALTPFARVFASKVVFGFGTRLLGRRVRGTEIELRLVPYASSLELYGANPYASPEDAASTPADMPRGRLPWTEAPRWRRVVAFVIAPRAAMLGLPLLLLGPTRTLHGVSSGVMEILGGAVSPFATARDVLAEAGAVAATEGAVTLVALALCKLVSFAVLALPSDLPFAMVRGPSKGVAKLRAAYMLVTFVVYAAWLVAWIAWAPRGSTSSITTPG